MPKTHEECLEILEQLRWNGIPTCPYCDSTKSSPIKSEHRYHCRECFTSYSVTVNTLFHRTKISLDKWFLAISLFSSGNIPISVRCLAKTINVNKNTASSILEKLRNSNKESKILIKKIAQYQKQAI